MQTSKCKEKKIQQCNLCSYLSRTDLLFFFINTNPRPAQLPADCQSCPPRMAKQEERTTITTTTGPSCRSRITIPLITTGRSPIWAGSVANPKNDDEGGLYIRRGLELLEADIVKAAAEMPDSLFIEYWGESVKPKDRIAKWLEKVDAITKGWKPSEVLFRNVGKKKCASKSKFVSKRKRDR